MGVDQKQKSLLRIDAVINIILGFLILLFPAGSLDLLGLPPVSNYFYTTVLGGVLMGIGLALLLESSGAREGFRGLGLGGAICINLCGGGALLVWLLVSPINLTLSGMLVLWAVCLVVLGIAAVELWKAMRQLGSFRCQSACKIGKA